jgi:hypothetical protein
MNRGVLFVSSHPRPLTVSKTARDANTKTRRGLYEIINRDEGTRGMIDPMLFGEDKVIGLMEKTIVLLKQLLALKKK